MKVFKFGGASVKDATSVKNVAEIVKSYPNDQLIIVVSAMGKITNAFEGLLNSYFHREAEIDTKFQEIKNYHFELLNELFPDETHSIYKEIHNVFVEVEWQLEDEPVGSYDFEYDQMVSIGEVLSTKIVSAYLNSINILNKWVDARDLIRTDNSYRKASVDWIQSASLCQTKIGKCFNEDRESILITQGFIGGTSENFTATLGREGSDFTAAILANTLKAEEVIIWKDVAGMLNADPKFFQKTVKLNNISYLEAVELAYYGASVIHPKTIKPLQNLKIPLYVKSFIKPNHKGTLINENTSSDSLIPSYIHKPKQILISISPKDYSFVTEKNLSEIYQLFSSYQVTINSMQNSAISFSVCVDEEQPKVGNLIKVLQEEYKVTYNDELQLITIRHYSDEIIDKLIGGREVLLEQKTRSTARFLIKEV